MKKQILFFSTLIILTCAPHHCSAMETEQPHFIPLNNGLLTEIKGKIAKTECGFESGRSITGITTKQDTLINLMHYQRHLDNNKGTEACKLFCPIVIRITFGEMGEGLGQFNLHQHKEAKEAIREKQAFYYNGNQGAIIYTLIKDDLKIDALKKLKDWIEEVQKYDENNVIIPKTCTCKL